MKKLILLFAIFATTLFANTQVLNPVKLVQSIPTSDAVDLEYFSIGTDRFLAVTNNYDGSTVNIDSTIYKYNGTEFVEFQSIPTNGAREFEYFEINGETYLAVANYYNGCYSYYT